MHIEQYLTNRNVWFEMILHRPAFTAQAAVRAMHVSPTEVAKGVLIKADELVVAVVPAHAHVDLVAVRKALDADDALLVHSVEFQQKDDNTLVSVGSDGTGLITINKDKLVIGFSRNSRNWSADCSR